MSDNVVQIKVVGDASAVAPAMDQAKGSIEGLQPVLESLNASFEALAADMRAAMAQGAASTAEMAAEMHVLEHETESEGLALGELVLKAKEAGEAMASFRESIMGLGEVLLAAFAVEAIAEFAEKMGEVAEKTQHLSEQFGQSVAQIQQLGGIATQTGVSLDTLTKGMGLLAKNTETQTGSATAAGTALKFVGVAASDGRTNMERLLTVADKFKEMDDGPKKVALAMTLFGKAGKELIPVLDLGREGLEKLNAKSEEYGVVNEAAQAKGMALAESINETHLAMQGVFQVMSDALAPVFKVIVDSLNSMILAFIESYKQGGIVAEIFAYIVGIVQEVGAVFDFLTGIIGALWEAASTIFAALGGIITDVFGIKAPSAMNAGAIAINLFKDALVVAKDIIIIAIDVIAGMLVFLIDEFKLFARQAYDAFTLNWGALDADWKAGTDKIARDVEASAARIKKAMAEAADAIAAAARGEGPTVTAGGVPEVKIPKGTGGLDLSHHAKEKKGKKEKTDKGPSEVELWKQELADKLLLEENWGVDEKAFTLKFWEDRLAQTKAGSKEELELRRMISAEKKAMNKAETADEIARIKELSAIQLDAAKVDGEMAKIGIQEKRAAIDAAFTAGKINAVQQAAAHKALNAELFQLDVDLANQIYVLKQKELTDDLALAGVTVEARKKINNQLELLEKQHLAAMALLRKQDEARSEVDEDKLLQAQRARYATMAKAYGDAIGKMATGQQGFFTTVNGLWSSMVANVGNMIAKMVEQWLVSLVVKEAASTSFHMKEVVKDAKGAAASAYRAVVGIPIVGPALAPIAAATAFAGVMAFSAAGGAGDVPYDNAPFLLHKNEMVLPASLASPLRSMLTAPAGNDNAPAAANGGGGDNHLHLHGDIIHNPVQLEAWFKKNASAVGAGARQYVRDGGNINRR